MKEETPQDKGIEGVMRDFNSKFPQEMIMKSTNWGIESDPKPKIKNWLRKTLTQAKEQEREHTIRLMQHQARNVLKSASAVADWGDLYLSTPNPQNNA